jgi:hypothetical protein
MGPILRISSDANRLLGVSSGELDKDFTFPPTQIRRISSEQNWPLKSSSILPEAVEREETLPENEIISDDASDETVIQARRATLAKLEGQLTLPFLTPVTDQFRTPRG